MELWRKSSRFPKCNRLKLFQYMQIKMKIQVQLSISEYLATGTFFSLPYLRKPVSSRHSVSRAISSQHFCSNTKSWKIATKTATKTPFLQLNAWSRRFMYKKLYANFLVMVMQKKGKLSSGQGIVRRKLTWVDNRLKLQCSGPWKGSVRGPQGRGRHFGGGGAQAPNGRQ